MAMATQKH